MPTTRLIQTDESLERLSQRRQHQRGGCPTCERAMREGDTFHPPHDLNPNCRSGGRTHCSCDVCF